MATGDWNSLGEEWRGQTLEKKENGNLLIPLEACELADVNWMTPGVIAP